MHLMATCLFVLICWACSTSENVPSPFFEISLYSIDLHKQLLVYTLHYSSKIHRIGQNEPYFDLNNLKKLKKASKV